LRQQFVSALIGAPFGLKGQVKLKPLSGEGGHLLGLETALLRKDGIEQTLRVEECISAPPGLLVKFSGIDSPEAAKALGGAELLLEREQASPLEDGEFYVEDLKGLAVFAAPDAAPESGGLSPDAAPLGHITDVVEGGGGELAEIRLADGGLKLVPFRKEFFVEINPEQGRVLLRNLWILK
jgi:16S rRNA processing protein RimM